MKTKKGKINGIIYAACLPGIQDIAAKHCYAIAVHGSIQTDMDLIAVPWVDNADPAVNLINSIALSLKIYGGTTPHGPEQKTHGRMVWTIPMGCGLQLDVSVTNLK